MGACRLRSKVLVGKAVNDGIEAGVEVGYAVGDDHDGGARLGDQLEIGHMLQEEHDLQRSPAQHERGDDRYDHDGHAPLALVDLLAFAVLELDDDQAVEDDNRDERQQVACQKEDAVVDAHVALGRLQVGLVGVLLLAYDVELEYANGAIRRVECVRVLLPQEQVIQIGYEQEGPEERNDAYRVLFVLHEAGAHLVYDEIAIDRHQHQYEYHCVCRHVRCVIDDAAHNVTEVPNTSCCCCYTMFNSLY